MEKFNQHTGLVAPMDRANIDTDLIIPKQFLKSIKRSGFGPNLFDSLRYQDEGFIGQDNSLRTLNADFILNQARYQGASILLARENFGCGSSREHAPWALMDFGFRAVIATSYADIFYNNSFKNGLLPIALPAEAIAELFDYIANEEGSELTVDLELQLVSRLDCDKTYYFDIDESRKNCLLNGLDEIGITLNSSSAIEKFEREQQQHSPWLYNREKVKM